MMNVSRAFLHEDGYIEVMLIGIPEPEELSRLIQETSQLLEQYGPANVLLNGRHGRAGRDAHSLSNILGMGMAPKLKNLVILTAKETNDPDGVVGPSVLASLLTAALGVSPVYIDSEAEARAFVTNQ